MRIFNKMGMVSFVFLFIWLQAVILRAEAAASYDLNFEKNTYYDVYFNSGQDTATVLEDVQILTFQDIGGRTFLVVKAHGFNLDDTKGFILFEAITAILPHRELRVKTGQGFLGLP